MVIARGTHKFCCRQTYRCSICLSANECSESSCGLSGASYTPPCMRQVKPITDRHKNTTHGQDGQSLTAPPPPPPPPPCSLVHLILETSSEPCRAKRASLAAGTSHRSSTVVLAAALTTLTLLPVRPPSPTWLWDGCSAWEMTRTSCRRRRAISIFGS